MRRVSGINYYSEPVFPHYLLPEETIDKDQKHTTEEKPKEEMCHCVGR